MSEKNSRLAQVLALMIFLDGVESGLYDPMGAARGKSCQNETYAE
jgi:hypothetical protein